MNKTVRYSELVADFQVDATFLDFVREWMTRRMPGMPLGLLDTEDVEKWEIDPPKIHAVKRLAFDAWICPSCEGVHKSENEECCYDDDDEPLKLVLSQGKEGWAVENEYTFDVINSSTDYAWADVTPWYDFEGGEDGVYLWDDEEEAEAAAAWCDIAYDNAHGYEQRHGFPWAHNYFFLPDNIPFSLLQEAGFTTATFLGEYTLCGIDGSGYNFESQHYARLVALVAEHYTFPVPSDQGDVFVTFDERSDLEKLGAVENEGGAE